MFYNFTSNRVDFGALIFGGEGINYYDPQEAALRDLWAVKLIETDSPSGFNFEWELLRKLFYNVTLTSQDYAWPERRTSFAYSSTKEGWLILYGGENPNSERTNPFLSDLWVYLGGEDTWLRLDAEVNSEKISMRRMSTFQTVQDLRGRPLGPGNRKDALLAVLPLTGRLVLIGGEVFKTSLRTDPTLSLQSVEAGSEEEDKGNNSNGRDYAAECTCAQDVLLLNHSVESLVAQRLAASPGNRRVEQSMADNGLSGGGGFGDVYGDGSSGSGSGSGNGGTGTKTRTELAWNIRRSLPGSCLGGASATAVVDPLDGREKVLIFGGRSRDARLKSMQGNAVASGSHSSRGRSGGKSGGSTRRESFLYSNKVWLYDVDADIWQLLGPSFADLHNSDGLRREGVWPSGRNRHSSAYHAPSDTVFVSGGRLQCAVARYNAGGSDREQLYTDTDDCSAGTPKEGDIHLDLWGFHLGTRRWTQYSDSGSGNESDSESSENNDSSESSYRRKQRRLAVIDTDRPSARYSHSMSVLSESQLKPQTQLTDIAAGDAGQRTLSSYPRSLSQYMRRLLGINAVETDDILLVVFGGQLVWPWSDTIGRALTERGQDVRGPGYFGRAAHTEFDDDAQGYQGLHAQTNDLWVFRLSSHDIASATGATLMDKCGWKLISLGGCHPGDDGRMKRLTVDTTGLVLAALLLLAIVCGLALYVILRRSQRAVLAAASTPDELERLLSVPSDGSSGDNFVCSSNSISAKRLSQSRRRVDGLANTEGDRAGPETDYGAVARV